MIRCSPRNDHASATFHNTPGGRSDSGGCDSGGWRGGEVEGRGVEMQGL